MKIFFFLFFLLGFLQAQIVVVTKNDSKIKKLQKEILQYLYLGKVDTIEGVRVRVLLSKDKKLHNDFCNKILDKSTSQYNSYWARLVFTGKKFIAKRLTPKEIQTEMQEPNTITYIKRENLQKGWRILYEE
ncbi:MAG: hypothetical protein AUK54_03865 [Helicobacteraceae bacterium CG2_30_36_10]|nr:MAG: hypothetical protein AUK54_03865 [Helicobacteraceae bacterium CG2_30_36_10]